MAAVAKLLAGFAALVLILVGSCVLVLDQVVLGMGTQNSRMWGPGLAILLGGAVVLVVYLRLRDD